MPSKIFTAALVGLDAAIVEVEAAAGGGDFGQITIVGLPDAAVSEARERVRSALRVCGRPYPRRKITVNLAPADLKKHGPAYDLPIALSILALQNNFKVNLDECLFAGELSLDGGLRPIAGALSLALIAQAKNFKKLFLPSANAAEAKLIKEIEVRPVKNLLQLVNHLSGREEIKPAEETILPPSAPSPAFDLAFIKGQTKAKRALEIAAAGGHNLLLFGPPGAGKTLLAKAFPGLLPPLSRPEMLAVTKIYSASGRLKDSAALVSQRPFRAPHHSASAAAIIGGGSSPRPGEISLAHHGVLFLDEFPEFSRTVIEGLRQPLEDGAIQVTRAGATLEFPARFILLAAMNPCPCGRGQNQACLCSPAQITRYRHRISGPILDRIDLHVDIPPVDWEKLTSSAAAETTLTVKARVAAASQKQTRRFQGQTFFNNAAIPEELVAHYCPLGPDEINLLSAAAHKMNLSARAYSRVLKTARTIADLAGAEKILAAHLAEALQYRPRL